MRVHTDNMPRPIIDGFELTASERERFDYLDWSAIDDCREGATFFRYRGELYDLGEFTTTAGLPGDSPLRAWDGYLSDSFFSAIAVRYVRPGYDDVVVGLALE